MDNKRNRGIYLLPNLLTTAGLFAAFYSIVASMKGKFDIAAYSIFIAMVADTLDGRVARLTATQSEFGAQYDSISDVLAFGLAPALLIYAWSLQGLGKVGWLVAFIYVAATALRLVRFNVHHDEHDPRFFQGLPCPTAAGLIASLVWFLLQTGVAGSNWYYVIGAITVVTALLMVSNIPFYSFKQIDFKGRVPFFAVIIVVALFVIITIDPPKVLFLVFSLYTVSGLIIWIYHWFSSAK